MRDYDPCMTINPQTLLDASLLLTDARGVAIRHLGAPDGNPWRIDADLPADTRAQLDRAMRQLAGDDALRSELGALIGTLDALTGRSNIFWFQEDFERGRSIIESLDGVTREVQRRLAEAEEDGWRPLEESEDEGGGLERSTRRASYSRNIAAG